MKLTVLWVIAIIFGAYIMTINTDDMTAFAGMQLEIGKRWVRDARCPAPPGVDPPPAPRCRAPCSPVTQLLRQIAAHLRRRTAS